MQREAFNRLGYTIGMMIFPGNKVDGAMTINGARGCDSRIADRFDLTAECICRQYLGEHAAAFVESRNRRIATHLLAGC